mmetsp:Transcript_22150/g.39810  ORF Transcript_22150/g.39810 Transcript_22150/m.39810 type:complete len:970 (-) Transcript_22150:86-2995(-)
MTVADEQTSSRFKRVVEVETKIEADDLHENSDLVQPALTLTPLGRLLRKKRARMDHARRRSIETSDAEPARLAIHRCERVKDNDTRDIVVAGMQQSRFCRNLHKTSLERIFDSMEYYEFEAGEHIAKQGEVGSYFFVTVTGATRTEMDGKILKEVKAVFSFGGVSLMYQCAHASSVLATQKTGLWAAPRKEFKRLVQGQSEAHLDENRGFLDQISLFDGLTAHQKESITSAALVIERALPGQVVAVEGAELVSLFVVKNGKLRRVSGGSFAEDGSLVGGTTVTELSSGRCFGERALWTGILNHSLVADTDCELIGVRVEQLREAFGADLAGNFQRLFIGSVLHQCPIVVHMAASQRAKLLNSMETRMLSAGERVDQSVKLLIVLEGQLSSGDVILTRGDWCQDELLSFQQRMVQNCKPCEPHDLTATNECTIVVATETTLTSCWEGLVDLTSEAFDQMHKMTLMRQVSMFKHFPAFQISELVRSLTLLQFNKGDTIFSQGDAGTNFFLVAKGHVEFSSKNVSGIQGPGFYHGERALILNELRNSKMQASSEDVEIWVLSRESFREVIPKHLRDELTQREELQNLNVGLKDLKHIQVIGAGGFGFVRLVEHSRTGNRYALKRIRNPNEAKAEASIKNECNLAMEIDHPFAAKTFAILEGTRSTYILSELITGGQLYDEITDRLGVLSRRQAQFYIGSLLLVLEFLHEKLIVYRDLKPENVMLGHDGYLKLVDFGISKKLDPARPRTYTVAGTIFYMSPEQLQGDGYSTEVDLWSLGVLLYELVCGFLPFGEGIESDAAVIKSIMEDDLFFPANYDDRSGKQLIEGLLQKKPSKRLGVGSFEDIKSSKFFKAGMPAGYDYFGKLLTREIKPPTVPAKDQYAKEATLFDVTLSDEEELAEDDRLPAREQVLQVFKSFDKNGDGKVDRKALTKILKAVNHGTSEERVTKLAWAADRKGSGSLSYDEFLQFIGI